MRGARIYGLTDSKKLAPLLFGLPCVPPQKALPVLPQHRGTKGLEACKDPRSTTTFAPVQHNWPHLIRQFPTCIPNIFWCTWSSRRSRHVVVPILGRPCLEGYTYFQNENQTGKQEGHKTKNQILDLEFIPWDSKPDDLISVKEQ